jgi:bacterial/archaeal transporter family-2 protein
MSGRMGVLESVFVIHLGGALVVGVPLLLRGGGTLGHWRSIPWYALTAGVYGLVVIAAVSYTIPRIGAAPTVVLIVAGQMVISTFIDHFGLFETGQRPLDLTRLVGIAVIFLGVWLMVRK